MAAVERGGGTQGAQLRVAINAVSRVQYTELLSVEPIALAFIGVSILP
jgi:hypothetical protein